MHVCVCFCVCCGVCLCLCVRVHVCVCSSVHLQMLIYTHRVNDYKCMYKQPVVSSYSASINNRQPMCLNHHLEYIKITITLDC